MATSCGPTNEKAIVYCILAHRPRPDRVLVGNSNVECRAYLLLLKYGAGHCEKINELLKSQFSFFMTGKIGIQLSPA